ncbi:SusE domain-containing protein [Mucilaginibacter sp.]|uniref:SusE domain-containing protein n=1 Tax=Mucilaginibacter sp. TaxID=1882438 RepID=UPI003D143784
MKKILLILMGLTLVVLSACKKDHLATVTSSIAAPVISNPADGSTINVTVADSAQVLKITWAKPDYGVDAVVSYFVQAGVTGNNFASAYALANLTSANSMSISYNSLNSRLISGLNLPPNATSSIQIRVGTAIYGKDTVYSKPVKIAFTTLALNQLWLPGSYEGYNPAGAPTIPNVTTTTYEGYAFFSAPGNFKFTSAPDYNHTNYGDAGNGKLTIDGNAGGIGYANAGVYKLNADITNLTYSAVYIQSFGIIGTATPQGWNASTAMTYNQANGTWSIKLNLVAGALKFRANDAWDINYGPADTNALTGTLIQTNDAITIPADGNYTVTIDMSQSVQKKYLYTVTKN